MLADLGTAERANAADAFLRARGIIVRKVGGYGLPHCLRVTVGTAEEVEAGGRRVRRNSCGKPVAEPLFRRLALLGVGLIGSLGRAHRPRSAATSRRRSSSTPAPRRRWTG